MRHWFAASAIATALTACFALPSAADNLQDTVASCSACHGENGKSEMPEVPSLGGQPMNYLLVQLYVFREKIRKVELMNEVAKSFTDDDLRAVSEAIAKLPPPPPANGEVDAARMQRAQALANQNKCNFCHTPTFAGQDQIPRLAGQREDYLLKALRDYKSGARAGYDPAMASVVQPMKDEEFADLAYYLARVQ